MAIIAPLGTRAAREGATEGSGPMRRDDCGALPVRVTGSDLKGDGNMMVPALDTLHANLEELACKRLPDGRPAFLFRGEREEYPETFSSLDRLSHGSSDFIYDDLDDVTAYAMKHPLRSMGLDAKHAGAFAQHYHLPTQVFDFTASPTVAINFAANRPHHRRSRSPFGRMAIFDVAIAEQRGHCVIFDLQNFQLAIRPRRQAAFGFIYSGFDPEDRVDLKATRIATAAGLQKARIFTQILADARKTRR